MSNKIDPAKIIEYACSALDWSFQKGDIADILFSRSMRDGMALRRAIDFGDFRLKNPKLSPSPIYINLRTTDHPITPGPLIPDDARKLGVLIKDKLFMSGINFDYVAGIPHGGEPIAKAFLDLFTDGKVREAKLEKIGQGGDRRIVNFKIVVPSMYHSTWKKVLLVDDVLSSGKSMLEAIEAVKKVGYEVSGIAVAVDREQGGWELLAKQGYGRIVSVFGISELLAFGVLTGRIASSDVFQKVMSYLDETREILLQEE